VKDFSSSKAGAISGWNENTTEHSLSRPFARLTGLFYGDVIEATLPEFAWEKVV